MLKLLRPVIDIESRPARPLGGVGEEAPSERASIEPMVEERPRRPSREGALTLGEERAERIDLGIDFVDSVRKRAAAAGVVRFRAEAARATCEEEGIGGVCVPEGSWSTRRAVKGGLPGGE